MARHLVEVGIVLDTEAIWSCTLPDGTGIDYKLCSKKKWKDTSFKFFPAPTMVELWRELSKTVLCTFVNRKFRNTNPVDTFSELLIWVKESKQGNG
jgi:hypothetical protein